MNMNIYICMCVCCMCVNKVYIDVFTVTMKIPHDNELIMIMFFSQKIASNIVSMIPWYPRDMDIALSRR